MIIFYRICNESEETMVSTHDGVVDYVLTKRDAFTSLSKVVLQSLAVTVSSLSSERDFRQLKPAVSKHC